MWKDDSAAQQSAMSADHISIFFADKLTHKKNRFFSVKMYMIKKLKLYRTLSD